MMFFRTVLKSSNYNFLSRRKSTFFAAPEVTTEFSAAWCLSIVSQARVVQRMDNAIHRINHCPEDSVVCFVNTYPLDSDLSAG